MFEGKYCFVRTEKNCFSKCTLVLSGNPLSEDYTENIVSHSRSTVRTETEIKGSCEEMGIESGYFDRRKVSPSSCKKRINCLFLYKHHFCLIMKSEDVTF